MARSGDAVHEKLERLKAIRKHLGWSEEFCAYQLGVTYSTLSRWERGESLPSSRAILGAVDRFIAKYSKARTGSADEEQQTGGSP